ncbi:MAG: S26 family signal peptidase [Candidatus Liptonbacteria bacterium]|nr:S26 family signal peptidase [Candidatus Liptonbacteria bacterium]
MLFLVKVEGESLWPELIPGKRYLATSLFKPNAGDYVIFKNPKNRKEIFVKKVKKIIADSYEVSGIVPWANSSREFGLIPKTLVLGKLILLSVWWRKY